ncbi:EAL domain-containing protein [Bradyrhizobium sp. AUGA SZCCT0283]|nr:EAL domain-containing protein [Bradyrhizobium sp. AUGA SZCCT0283]
MAEGVETDTQFDLLRQQGCTQAQGYLFSPPHPVAEVETMLSKARARVVAWDSSSPVSSSPVSSSFAQSEVRAAERHCRAEA